MAHDIFISYSHHDKPTADAICAKLESEGLRCWYAPRDIAPGEDWAAAIIDGIKAAKVFVLVFTGYSNGSQQVLREIGAAVTQGLPIIPFKMTDTLPSKGMQYYLSTVHWLDAVDGQLYKNIDILGKRIRAVLGAEEQRAEGSSSESGFSSVSDAEEQRHQGRNSRKGINIAVAVLVLVLAAVILWQAGVFGGKAPEGATVPDTVQETDTEQTPEVTQAAENTPEPTEEISEQPTETPSEVPTDGSS